MTISLSTIELEARAATPGPWAHDKSSGQIGDVVAADMHTVAQTQERRDVNPRSRPAQRDIDAAFIAAANPQTILKLVEIARAAKACDRQLSMSALQPDSDEAVALREALKGVES